MHLTETKDAIDSKLSGCFESVELIWMLWLAEVSTRPLPLHFYDWYNYQRRVASVWPLNSLRLSHSLSFGGFCPPPSVLLSSKCSQLTMLLLFLKRWDLDLHHRVTVFLITALNGRALKNKGGVLFTSRKQHSIVDISLGSRVIENNLFVIEMIAKLP